MNYASWDFEKKYMTQPDPLFKFYIGCALFVLICMGIIQGVVMPRLVAKYTVTSPPF